MKHLSFLSFISLAILSGGSAVSSVLHPPQLILRPDDKNYPEMHDRAFQGIPGLAVSEKGRLWATWYSGPAWSEDHQNYIVLATSSDAGENWLEVMAVDVDGPSGPLRTFDPVLWFDPEGRLWWFWSQAVAERHRRAQTWAMRAYDPEDGETKWTDPFHIAPGVMMNKPTVLRNGDWLLPISNWEVRRMPLLNMSSAAVYLSKPDWEGDFFLYLGAAQVPSGHGSADEHMIVEKEDGNLWMLVRTNYGIGESTSKDKGLTWTEVAPSDIKHPPSRFFISRLDSGNLLLVKHGPIDEKLDRRTHLKAFLSKDDGTTWKGGFLIDERGSSYPDGQQAADGTIHIVYDRDRGHFREILMATFREEDVLARKNVSGTVRLRVPISSPGIEPAPPADPYDPEDFELSQNEDGIPLDLSNPAVLTPEDGGEFKDLKRGEQVFSDRFFSFSVIPEPLIGKYFIRSSIMESRARAVEAGYVHVIARRNLIPGLKDAGFEKTALPDFIPYAAARGYRQADACVVMQKYVEPGEIVEYGLWGITLVDSHTPRNSE